jgi:hypothetical protein
MPTHNPLIIPTAGERLRAADFVRLRMMSRTPGSVNKALFTRHLHTYGAEGPRSNESKPINDYRSITLTRNGWGERPGHSSPKIWLFKLKHGEKLTYHFEKFTGKTTRLFCVHGWTNRHDIEVLSQQLERMLYDGEKIPRRMEAHTGNLEWSIFKTKAPAMECFEDHVARMIHVWNKDLEGAVK